MVEVHEQQLAFLLLLSCKRVHCVTQADKQLNSLFIMTEEIHPILYILT